MNSLSTPLSRPRLGGAVFLLFFLLYGAYSYLRYEPHSFTRADPAWMAHAVISLAEDQDIDLRNQLGNDPARAADQTALGARGEWYPLHEPVLAIVALPFYLGAGINGLLLFNLLCAATTQTLLFMLCTRYAPPLLALGATILIGCGTLFLVYSYSFSQDLWGALLTIAAFAALAHERPRLGGVLFGLAVLSRYVMVAAAPGLLFLICLKRDKRALGRFLIAGAPFAVVLLLSNWWCFGSPWQTSYHHWQRFEGGSLQLVNQLQATFVKPWGVGIAELLLDPVSGFHGSLPMWPLVLLGLIVGAREHTIVAAFLVAIGQLLLFSRFEGYPGTPGNRYLMVSVGLAALPTALLLDRLTTLFWNSPAKKRNDLGR